MCVSQSPPSRLTQSTAIQSHLQPLHMRYRYNGHESRARRRCRQRPSKQLRIGWHHLILYCRVVQPFHMLPHCIGSYLRSSSCVRPHRSSSAFGVCRTFVAAVNQWSLAAKIEAYPCCVVAEWFPASGATLRGSESDCGDFALPRTHIWSSFLHNAVSKGCVEPSETDRLPMCSKPSMSLPSCVAYRKTSRKAGFSLQRAIADESQLSRSSVRTVLALKLARISRSW
jgi:hypothetical protein